VKHITMPLKKVVANVPMYLKFLKPIYQSTKELTNSPIKNAPMMSQVLDFTTGEICEIILATVLLKELTQAFEGDSYVGKCFEIVMHKSGRKTAAGQEYNLFNITEIGEPEGEDLELLQGLEKTPEVSAEDKSEPDATVTRAVSDEEKEAINKAAGKKK
jgi:hypothetical protein